MITKTRTLDGLAKVYRRKRFWHGWQVLAVTLAGVAVAVVLRLLRL